MPRTHSFNILGYAPAEAHHGKCAYVDFYVRDPVTGGKRRQRIKLNRIPPASRRQYARQLVLEINAKLAVGWNPLVGQDAPKSHYTMAQALDAYLRVKVRDTRHSSPKTYVSFTGVLSRWCQRHRLLDKPAAHFNRTHALLFLDHLLDEREVGNHTYNNYILRSSILFGWLVEREYRSDNPFKGMRRRRKEEKFRTLISPDERTKCLAWFQKHDPPMVLVCMWVFHTLLRPRSELLRIKVKDIDLQHGVVNIDGSDSKSASIRRPAIPDVMMPFIHLTQLASANPSHYLVGKGLVPCGEKLGHNTLGYRWNRMRKALGWGADKALYSLRDSGIVQLITDGLDLHYVMRQAGHKNIETTNRYIQHYFPNGQKEVREKATAF